MPPGAILNPSMNSQRSEIILHFIQAGLNAMLMANAYAHKQGTFMAAGLPRRSSVHSRANPAPRIGRASRVIPLPPSLLPLRLRPAGADWDNQEESGLISGNAKRRLPTQARPLAGVYIRSLTGDKTKADTDTLKPVANGLVEHLVEMGRIPE